MDMPNSIRTNMGFVLSVNEMPLVTVLQRKEKLFM